MMIITIGGKPGSGKSTVGRMLAEHLQIPFFSMGDIRRQYALAHGMTINELNQVAETDRTSDDLVDKYQEQLPRTNSSFVIDARLGYFFLPQSVKVFIDVDTAEATKRIMAKHRDSESIASSEEGIAMLRKRQEDDRIRYKRLYGTDPLDMQHYDLVIDSTNITPQQTFETIIAFLR